MVLCYLIFVEEKIEQFVVGQMRSIGNGDNVPELHAAIGYAISTCKFGNFIDGSVDPIEFFLIGWFQFT